jgi:hypothetical protein
MTYYTYKDISDPEQLRQAIRSEMEPWIKKHHKTLDYQNRLSDLLVIKVLAEREPNRILWTRPDIVDIKARTSHAGFVKEMLELARQEKNKFLEETLKEEQQTLDRSFERTTWVCYEKPVWCSIGVCRNKSDLVLTSNLSDVFDRNHIYAKWCPKHAKSFHRHYACGLYRGKPESKRQRIKRKLWMAEMGKKLRDMGIHSIW